MTLRLATCGIAFVLTAVAPSVLLRAQEPALNPRFPIENGGQLSPPQVWPVGECAKKVHVSGFIPHALVRVYVNGALAGSAKPDFGDADIALAPMSPPLSTGDELAATQEVMGFASSKTNPAVKVSTYPGTLNIPQLIKPMYACGQVVDVDGLNPGAIVDVFRNGGTALIGEADVIQPGAAVATASLNQNDQITAAQSACREYPTKSKQGPPSNPPKSVQPNPSPMVAPTAHFVIGADIVVLDNLYIGAAVQVFDNGTAVAGGLANASLNAFHVSPSTTNASHIAGAQKLCGSPVRGPEVTGSATLGKPIITPPLCEGQPTVTVANTYPGSILVLLRNGSLASVAGGGLGNVQISLGNGQKWNLGDQAQVVQYIGALVSDYSDVAYANCAPQNVITQHNDNARSGATLAETALKPSNVNSSTFGRLFEREVEGDVVAQPLYVKSVHTSTQGVKNLFFVVTSKNWIYAFDADAQPNSANTWVWRKNLCGSRHLCVGLLGSNPAATDPPNCGNPQICSETRTGFVGITSTPVIEPSTQTMYVVARCSQPRIGMEGDGSVHIYAINLADGNIRKQVEIAAVDPLHTTINFDSRCQRNRPGLLLSNGVVYVAFASFECDHACPGAPYRGWVIGYRASDLSQAAVFVTGPNGGESGIWQTGNGLAGASDGSIYFETGNGPNGENLQDAFVKLVPTSGPGGLSLAGFFQPNNAKAAPTASWAGSGTRRSLSAGDTDLGSGGPMLLPEGLLIGGGKQGRYYVLEQTTMHLAQDDRPLSVGFNGFQAFTNTFHNEQTDPACPEQGGPVGCAWWANGGHCYISPNRYGDGEQCGPNIHAGPVYWQTSPSSGLIYKMPEKDSLKAFRYNIGAKRVIDVPNAVAAGPYGKPPLDGMPGGFSSISADAMTDGIVWTSVPVGNGQGDIVPGVLAAHDATPGAGDSLAELWHDADPITFAKSVPPTIANGRVFRAVISQGGTQADNWDVRSKVIVYGLLPRPIQPAHWPLNQACYEIKQKHSNYGGAMGILGSPVSDELAVGDAVGGRYRNYHGFSFGIARTVASVESQMNGSMFSCSNPRGTATPIDSSIYWNPATCAHVVTGDIRKLYLKLGGPKGRLGYPLEDETFSPDHYGRISRFEHGDIVWYPDKGAKASYTRSRNDKVLP